MRKFGFCLALLPLLAVIAAQCCPPAMADGQPQPTPAVEWIYLEAVPTATPTPPPREIHYNEHPLTQDEIDEMAAIFWADCNTDEEKLCYAAVAVNRLVHGAPFGDDLNSILKAKSEWNHGKVSDRNRKKAERFLNMALTQFVDGEYAGILVPPGAVYVSRESGKLVFYNANFEEAYRLD